MRTIVTVAARLITRLRQSPWRARRTENAAKVSTARARRSRAAQYSR